MAAQHRSVDEAMGVCVVARHRGESALNRHEVDADA
jgi:hypothetical protein